MLYLKSKMATRSQFNGRGIFKSAGRGVLIFGKANLTDQNESDKRQIKEADRLKTLAKKEIQGVVAFFGSAVGYI